MSFIAAASKILREHHLADGEGDAPSNETSEVTKEAVLPNGAEDAGSYKSADNDNSEHENTDSQSRSGSNRQEQYAISTTGTKSKGAVSTSKRGNAEESEKSQPNETGDVAPSEVTLEEKGVTDDPMLQEEEDDTLDTSAGATRGGIQAENSEGMGASTIGAGRRKGGSSDKEAPYRKGRIAEGSGMQSGDMNTGATLATGKDQIERGGAAPGERAFPFRGESVASNSA